MDPANIVIIITTASTLLLNLYQSVRSRHFESHCCPDQPCGFDCVYESEHVDKDSSSSSSN